MNRSLPVIIGLLLAATTWAQTPADTLEQNRSDALRPQQLVVPAAMIAVGAAAISAPRLRDIRLDVRDAMQRGRAGHRKANVETWVALTAQFSNVVLGPRPNRPFVSRMLVKATSYALLYSTVPVVRRCVHSPRPDGHGDHSFPSLKTASAFMAAEQTRIERGWGWGMGMYTVAAGIGVLQMYNDRAYVNDVIAGAGMGILCAHAAYWLLPLERRLLGLDKKKGTRETEMMFAPTYDPSTRTAGVSFAAQL